MKIIKVPNYQSFEELYSEYEQKKDTNDLKNLVLLFVASNDPQTNESWCSDCRNSKPIIDAKIEDFKFNEMIVLAVIEVGQRDEWKAGNNPFKNHKVHITAVPTILSLKTGLRLVEAECADAAKVSHLFSNSL